jgi:hypothetical protein
MNTEMMTLAQNTINEMPMNVRADFMARVEAGDPIAADILKVYAEQAMTKHTYITNLLLSYPHKMKALADQLADEMFPAVAA